MVPLLGVVALVCALVVVEPDLGTGMIACLATAALLVAAGARLRDLATLAAVLAGVVLVAITVEPYRMERLTGFVDPSADPRPDRGATRRSAAAGEDGGRLGGLPPAPTPRSGSPRRCWTRSASLPTRTNSWLARHL